MVATTFLLLLAQGLFQYPQQAGDGLDEAALERTQQRAEYLKQQMTRLLQELEQKNLEQSGGAWGSLLGWQFWAVLGILVVLLALWFGHKKIRWNPDSSGPREISFSIVVEEEKGDNVVAREEIENSNENVEEEQDSHVESNHQSIFEEVVQCPVAYLVEHLIENMVENLSDD